MGDTARMSTAAVGPRGERTAPSTAPAGLEELALSAQTLAERPALPAALGAVAQAAAAAAGAELVVVRTLDPDGAALTAGAVASPSPALVAELEGARLSAAGLSSGEQDEKGDLPEVVRALAERIGAGAVLQLPLLLGGRLAGTLELYRRRPSFVAGERLLARLAAAQAALALAAARAAVIGTRPVLALELAGEGLAATAAGSRTEDDVARLALGAADARAAFLWRPDESGGLRLVAAAGATDSVDEPALRGVAEAALSGAEAVILDESGAAGATATLQIGRPPLAVLQLVLRDAGVPGEDARAGLAAFGVRAAQALRTAESARSTAAELEQARTLLAVVAQANAELSVSHALGTAVARVAELLGVERVAVYLREDNRLLLKAAQALDGPHTPVAERLLELALGPLRGRGMVLIEDARNDRRLASVREELAETGIEAAVAVPLVVAEGVTGLLALYPPRSRVPTPDEWALLGALSAQLAVTVENARLHERTADLGKEVERALLLERQAARRVNSQYEISRSFAQSLSLQTTLDAVASTVVQLLGVDAAAIHMPDERGETLVARALHVADESLRGAVAALLERPQPLARLPGRLFRARAPLMLDAVAAAAPGSAYEVLTPFLEKGSTAVVLPIATPTELLGTLTLLSLDPEAPITTETADLALSVAGQAALAVDNARLYQQQKLFSDTMQRSLLPRSQPELPGLDLGAVYESSARVDVGGDVYDFLTLPDGRLAVVLGDVTGHGIEAAADMAMAKFVFRSLAREHAEPGEFLSSANEVVCGEIAPGKFITMAYLTIDASSGMLAAAAAGHPRPRLVLPDGTVETLAVGGLALGIVNGQAYEEVRRELPPGASVVVFTDGAIEARREGELFGDERLDRLLSEQRGLSARKLAAAVVEACRAWSGGELADDCAIVVIKRAGGP